MLSNLFFLGGAGGGGGDLRVLARKLASPFGHRLGTQCKSLRKFNLCSLATACRSVWPGLKAGVHVKAVQFEGYRMVYRKRCVSENISPLSKSRHSKQESRNLGVATR